MMGSTIAEPARSERLVVRSVRWRHATFTLQNRVEEAYLRDDVSTGEDARALDALSGVVLPVAVDQGVCTGASARASFAIRRIRICLSLGVLHAVRLLPPTSCAWTYPAPAGFGTTLSNASPYICIPDAETLQAFLEVFELRRGGIVHQEPCIHAPARSREPFSVAVLVDRQ